MWKVLWDCTKSFNKKCNWRTHLCKHVDGTLKWYFKMIGPLESHSLECLLVSLTYHKKVDDERPDIQGKKGSCTRLYKTTSNTFIERLVRKTKCCASKKQKGTDVGANEQMA